MDSPSVVDNFLATNFLSLFTADLRRQLANDHCNSSSFLFISPGDEFFFVLLWRCGTLDDRHARNLASVGSNFATILPCSNASEFT